MRTYVSLLIVTGALLGFSALASSNFKSQISYLNPNGCRAFDLVVDPNCPSTIAPSICSQTKAALKQINLENPKLELDSKCGRIHTGSGIQRAIDERMMHSPSFDGYAIKMTIPRQSNHTQFHLDSITPSEEACALTANAFLSFNKNGLPITAQCYGKELVAEIKF